MNRVVFVVLLMALIAVGVGGYLFFQNLTQGFPELAPGTYAGQLVYSEDGRTVPWFVERTPSTRKLQVGVGEPTMPAQEVSMPEPSASSGLPLILVGTDIRLRFVGRQVEGELLEGSFENPISGTRGTWNLRKTEMAEIGSAVEADLQAWTVLANELSTTEKQIETAQAKFDAQQGKLEKLSRFIVDEDSLREKANTRYGATSDAVSEARAKLAQLRTDLDAAVRNVELSHRISPRGRLALLARESLQRESRWVEIGLNLLAPQAAPDYEQHLERAHRVKRIIDDIAQEQRLIAEYQAGERYKGEAAETAAEEEFYGGFDQQ